MPPMRTDTILEASQATSITAPPEPCDHVLVSRTITSLWYRPNAAFCLRNNARIHKTNPSPRHPTPADSQRRPLHHPPCEIAPTSQRSCTRLLPTQHPHHANPPEITPERLPTPSRPTRRITPASTCHPIILLRPHHLTTIPSDDTAPPPPHPHRPSTHSLPHRHETQCHKVPPLRSMYPWP